MGSRLPPGEAERRKKERMRAFFAGEKHKHYDPEKEGYGSFSEWASMASAFVSGDFVFSVEADMPKGNTAGTEPPKAKPRHTNPDFDVLGLDAMPADVKELTGFYRRAVFTAFKAAGSSDTAPAYVNAFMAATKAFEKIKRQRGWK